MSVLIKCFVGCRIEPGMLMNLNAASHPKLLSNIFEHDIYYVYVWYGHITHICLIIRTIRKFLSPDALLVHASIKLHFSLSLVISPTKQNQNKTQNNDFCTWILVRFDARLSNNFIIRLCFSNNFIFLFYRYYYFNVYFFNVCLHINRM